MPSKSLKSSRSIKKVEKQIANKVVKKIKSASLKPKRKKSALMPKISGNGDYVISGLPKTLVDAAFNDTPSQGIVNKFARRGASMIGDYFFPGLGRYAGNVASSLARWLGHGSYSIQSNSMLCGSLPVSTTFGKNPGSLRYQDSEYIGPVFVNDPNFSLTNYLINPGNPVLFPFLSTMATLFEEFEFHGLVFYFKTTSSEFNTNVGMGSVTMATDYDVYDVNFSNLTQMMRALFHTTEKPSKDQYHPIECARGKSVLTKMYVQSATTIADLDDDARFNFLGNFQIATQGTNVAEPTQIGELHVAYDVTLMKPQISNAVVNNGFYAHYNFAGTQSAFTIYPVTKNPSSVKEPTVQVVNTQTTSNGLIINFNGAAHTNLVGNVQIGVVYYLNGVSTINATGMLFQIGGDASYVNNNETNTINDVGYNVTGAHSFTAAAYGIINLGGGIASATIRLPCGTSGDTLAWTLDVTVSTIPGGLASRHVSTKLDKLKSAFNSQITDLTNKLNEVTKSVVPSSASSSLSSSSCAKFPGVVKVTPSDNSDIPSCKKADGVLVHPARMEVIYNLAGFEFKHDPKQPKYFMSDFERKRLSQALFSKGMSLDAMLCISRLEEIEIFTSDEESTDSEDDEDYISLNEKKVQRLYAKAGMEKDYVRPSYLADIMPGLGDIKLPITTYNSLLAKAKANAADKVDALSN